jgi:hypothetical protein
MILFPPKKSRQSGAYINLVLSTGNFKPWNGSKVKGFFYKSLDFRGKIIEIRAMARYNRINIGTVQGLVRV